MTNFLQLGTADNQLEQVSLLLTLDMFFFIKLLPRIRVNTTKFPYLEFTSARAGCLLLFHTLQLWVFFQAVTNPVPKSDKIFSLSNKLKYREFEEINQKFNNYKTNYYFSCKKKVIFQALTKSITIKTPVLKPGYLKMVYFYFKVSKIYSARIRGGKKSLKITFLIFNSFIKLQELNWEKNPN